MLSKGIRKIKVLGYPFAGGQGKSGVELTPQWLAGQPWFTRMQGIKNVEFEMVPVTNGSSNLLSDDEGQSSGSSTDGSSGARNIRHVMHSSMSLRLHVSKALKDGYFPVVIGGDHSMAIGSISGLKDVHPDAKLIWMDAHIDANTPDSSPSGNIHGMPLAYLAGLVPFQRHWKCLDLERELCYFGIRSYEPDELQLVREKGCLVFESEVCKSKNLDKIHHIMNSYFAPNRAPKKNYWVSFDIDSVDAAEFGSTGTAEFKGLSLDFCQSLFQRFLPRSLGMDLTEVNFKLATSQDQLRADEQTVRELLECIVDSVNRPHVNDEDLGLISTEDLVGAKDLHQPNFKLDL